MIGFVPGTVFLEGGSVSLVFFCSRPFHPNVPRLSSFILSFCRCKRIESLGNPGSVGRSLEAVIIGAGWGAAKVRDGSKMADFVEETAAAEMAVRDESRGL